MRVVAPILLSLPPQYFWDIHLPTFGGGYKTLCRAVIKSGRAGDVDIVSEEWVAGINPAQFWRAPFHRVEDLFKINSEFFAED